MLRFLRFCVAFCLCLSLSACGFTLRGVADLPAEFQTLLLESTDGNSEIMREMRRSLLASGVDVVDSAGDGIYRLGLGREQVEERVLSVNSNARAGEYELSMSLPFQLRDANTEFVIPTQTLTIDMVYLADPENAVAKAEEARLIQEEMRRELVAQVLRRLQTVSP